MGIDNNNPGKDLAVVMTVVLVIMGLAIGSWLFIFAPEVENDVPLNDPDDDDGADPPFVVDDVPDDVPSTNDILLAVATVDRDVIRVDEFVAFSSDNSQGEIVDRVWKIYDETINTSINFTYHFLEVGIYNITLTIWDLHGNESKASLDIGVQQTDIITYGETGRYSDTDRNSASGLGFRAYIGTNIGNPDVRFTAQFTRPAGMFEIMIRATWESDYDDNQYSQIHEETITTIGLDYTYEHLVRGDELTSEIRASRVHLDMWIMIDQGRWENLTITIEVNYPIDVL